MRQKRIGLKKETTVDRYSYYVDMNNDFELEKCNYADIPESVFEMLNEDEDTNIFKSLEGEK